MSDDRPTRALRRRELLKATGAGMAGAVGLTGAAAAAEEDTTAEGPNGSGTASDPYVITSASELRAMAEDPSGSFVLDSDVDASDVGGEKGFQPITDFAGTFDGKGHEISGLTIDRPGVSGGLFGNTTESATIKNVGLTDVDVTGGYSTGALVGRNEGTVDAAYAAGQITAESDTVGGLIGYNGGEVTESFATASVEIAGNDKAGGFVGYNQGTVRDAYATGDVHGDPDCDDIGGFVGYNYGTVETSFATGIVGGNGVGGFAGYNYETITDCYWDTVESGLSSTAGGATGLTTDQIQGDTAASSLTGFDFSAIWSSTTGSYPVLSGIDTQGQLDARPDQRSPESVRLDQMAGDGSGNDPYVITSGQEVRAMADDPIAFFELDADVDLGDIGGEKGFQPITDFMGAFDGKGHEISGLTIDRPGVSGGLFGNTTESATVERVGLTNVDVTGGYSTGALVGRNEGTVDAAYAAGQITAESDTVGGLIGYNGGEVAESFATASVEIAGNDKAGGFVGYNQGTVRDAYATGDVHGGPDCDDIGGFVGYNYGTVETSFATGIVGGNGVGGFAGYNYETITDCYWDTVESGLSSTAGGATGLTTDQMQGDTATFNLENFDFGDNWTSVDSAYPVLAGTDTQAQLDARPAQRAPESVRLDQMAGDGSGNDPYVITSGQEVRAMADDPIAFFELGADVDLADIGGSNGFQPITDFMGSLDGRGYEISGLTIDRPDVNGGLFGNLLQSATVDHVTLVGVDVTGGYRTGGLVGFNGGTVTRVAVDGSVGSEQNTLGGLVGYNDGEVSESRSSATVTATDIDEVGGFVGYNQGTIRDAYATGDVESGAGSDEIGGFVGYNYGTVETSFATGGVTGNNIGGFAGYNYETITDCYWDTEASGVDSTNGGATGLTTDQMQGDTATFNLENFDFEDNWTVVAGGYPELAFESEGPPSCPTVDGTKTADLDGDGRCEDFNGNGRLDFDDVNTFYDNTDADPVTNNDGMFDHDDDGDVDVFDVLELFNDVA